MTRQERLAVVDLIASINLLTALHIVAAHPYPQMKLARIRLQLYMQLERTLIGKGPLTELSYGRRT